jgi:DNA-binding MarR family transcriptional regulator
MLENRDLQPLRKIETTANTTRWNILLLLRKEIQLYPSEIAKRLNIQRKVISYHLKKLEELGLVQTRLKLIYKEGQEDRPRSVKYYYLTLKGLKLVHRISTPVQKNLSRHFLRNGYFNF